jgi:hypothetical protein
MIKKDILVQQSNVYVGNFLQLKVPNMLISDIITGYDRPKRVPIYGCERSDDLE